MTKGAGKYEKRIRFYRYDGGTGKGLLRRSDIKGEDEFLYYGKTAASVVYPEYGEDKKGCGKDQLYGGRFGCGPDGSDM